MISSEKLVPLAAAIISAAALIGCYMYQKHQEREAEINRMRQGVYSRLVTNITDRNEIWKRIPRVSAGKRERNTKELQNLFASDAKGAKNEADMKEIGASLILYGTDDAIRAYASYLEKANSGHGSNDDVGQLIVDLRKTIYPRTKATVNDANKVIWNEPQYFKPLAAK